jgi:hypothetical protein
MAATAVLLRAPKRDLPDKALNELDNDLRMETPILVETNRTVNAQLWKLFLGRCFLATVAGFLFMRKN